VVDWSEEHDVLVVGSGGGGVTGAGFESNDELRREYGVPGQARDTMGLAVIAAWRFGPASPSVPTPI